MLPFDWQRRSSMIQGKSKGLLDKGFNKVVIVLARCMHCHCIAAKVKLH